MAAFTRELGVDLGTLNTQIAEGNQILIQEPTIVAILVDELKIVEYGSTALGMLGRVPEAIEVIRPMRNSTIAEYEITEKFFAYAESNRPRADLQTEDHDHRSLWDYKR